MFAHWRDHPPVYLLLQALIEGLGGTAGGGGSRGSPRNAQVDPASLGAVPGFTGAPAAIVAEFAELKRLMEA